MLKPADFFSDGELFRGLFPGDEHLWDGIRNIRSCIADLIRANVAEVDRSGPMIKETTNLPGGARVYEGACLWGDDIELKCGAVVEPGACIKGPAIIGQNTEVRHGAYVRGNVITGPDCVIGHATEVKNSALLGCSKAGHFAYIGDSILGAVNLGAGTKLANLKMVDSEILVRVGRECYNTGLRKMGAVMGDGCQTGCNSTTAPGTVMSKNVLLYPNTYASGFYEPDRIVKLRQDIEIIRR